MKMVLSWGMHMLTHLREELHMIGALKQLFMSEKICVEEALERSYIKH